MQVDSIATLAANSSVKEAPKNELNSDAFLTLLVAQLRNQDPLKPMDPTEFVTQLVQFNVLEQTIQIRQVLEKNSSGPATGATPLTQN